MQACLSYPAKKESFFSTIQAKISPDVAKNAPQDMGAASKGEVLDQTRQIAYTFAVIALASRLVKVDGEISRKRYLAFRTAFPVQASEDEKISQLFELAIQEGLSADHYVQRIVRLYPGKQKLYFQTVAKLAQIVDDGAEQRMSDYNYLRHLADRFGLAKRDWRQIEAALEAPKQRSPYAVLGVGRFWSMKAIHQAYRRLIREYHPDHFCAQGASRELVDMLSARMADINAAYADIERTREGFARRWMPV